MTRRFHVHVILLLSCTLLGPPVNGDELDLGVIRATLGKLAQKELKKGVASISMALVKDGEIVMKEAWGHANVWSKSPATPESIYCTGSTFKAVTATALLQLVEQVENDERGVKVFIGSEHALVNLEQVSVVLSRYEGGQRIVGTLGVIGPRSMAYDRVLPIVDCTARWVSRMLGGMS